MTGIGSSYSSPIEGELSVSDIFKPHTHASYRSHDQTNHSMMMNEDLPSAGGSNDRKWTRAGKPKVKTGCVTCKIRRVKCGEEKPECQRCIKFGLKCDGYVPVSLPSTTPKKPRKLQPSYRPLRPSAEQSLSTILPEPCSSRFQNQEEYHFFQLFTTKTAPHLSGYLDPVLWNRIMLQVSESEGSIRHAVISIGALDMSVVPSHPIGFPGKSTTEVSQRQLFALEQYSKAIKELRRNVFISKYDLRTVLIASILIICFETFHQNYDSAASQIRTAVRLIESSGDKLASNREIEQDLVCTFDRLEIQSMSRTDPHIDLFTIDEHLALKESGAAFMAGMPDEFEDVATARNYLYNLVRRHAHFTFMVRKKQAMARKEDPSFSYINDESVIQERVKSYQEKERWMQAFEPLYKKHRTLEQREGRTREFLAVSVMRIHFLIVMCTLLHLFETSEMHFDKSFGAFKELVDLCEDVIGPENGDGERVFVFEMQTLMALDNIAKKCRDPVVRRRAVALLKRRPMREGVRDSVLSAKVGEWVIGVEEEGMVDGFIGEEWRTRDVSVRVEDGERKARVGCWVGRGFENRREEAIEW